MVAPGMVNLDFADIRTVMAEMGKAMMGTGEADGEGRALRAAELAISNPLLEDTSMSGARGLLINITGGDDLTLFEVDQAANRIREEVDEDANIIFGSAIDESLNGRIRVSVVATGIETAQQKQAERPHLVAVGGGSVMPMAQAVAQHHASGAPVQAPAPSQAPSAQAQPAPLPPQRPTVARMPQPAGRPMPLPAARPAPQAYAQQSYAQPATAPRPMEHRPAEQRPTEQRPMEQRHVEPRFEPAPHQAAPVSYEAEIDEAPLPPRQIPPHLQQPLRPQAAARPTARASEARPVQPKSGLFNEAPRGDAPAPARKSLFGIVTGAIRGHAHAEPAPQPEPQPAATAYAEPRPEPARAAQRPAGGEEMGIEIPAFLRRQS
jgi:cell division protein FtsZ